MVSRFEMYYVNLDPTEGEEIRKTHPCVIISPDEINHNISTVIIAPITSVIRNYPTRIECKVGKRKGSIVLDQIRTVDKSRLFNKLGILEKKKQTEVLGVLREMFSE